MWSKNKKILAVVLATVIFSLGIFAGYYVHGQPIIPKTLTWASGIFPGSPSYTVWGNGSFYWAKSQYGSIDYSSSNASYVLDSVLALGGSIFVEAGIYAITNTLLITRNNTRLIGAGPGANQSYFTQPLIPLPRLTLGTVFRVTTASIDCIQIIGNLYGIDLEHFAIDLTPSSTGNGIDGVCNGYVGVSNFIINDVFINNNDASHFGIKLQNGILGTLTEITDFGGPFLELADLSTTAKYGSNFNAGNLVCSELLGWAIYTLTLPEVYVNSFGVAGMENLIVFNRLQTISTGSVSETQAGIFLNDTHCITFNGLDSEFYYSTTATDEIDVIGSIAVQFNNPYCMANPDGQWYMGAGDNICTINGGKIDVAIYDVNPTDLWSGVAVGVGVGSGWVADFEHGFIWNSSAGKYLPTYNVGYVTFSSNSSVTFMHGLAFAPNEVFASFSSTGCGAWTWTTTGNTKLTITVATSGTYTCQYIAIWYPFGEQKGNGFG